MEKNKEEDFHINYVTNSKDKREMRKHLEKYCRKCRQPITAGLVKTKDGMKLQYRCRCGESFSHIPSEQSKDYEKRMEYFKLLIHKIDNLNNKIFNFNNGILTIQNSDNSQEFKFDKFEICKPYISFYKEKIKVCFKLTFNNENKYLFIDISKRIMHNYNIGKNEHVITLDDNIVKIDYCA